MTTADQWIVIALCQFHSIKFVAELDLIDANRSAVINQIISGELDDVVAVYEFNPRRGGSRDISKEVATEVAARCKRFMRGHEFPPSLRNFIEEHLGIGTVLEPAA